MKYQQGVTLVELIMLIIVLGVIAIPLSNGFLSVSQALMTNNDAHQANNLTRACAEHLLYQRRSGTTTFNTTDCDGLPGFSASGTVSITASDSSNNAPLCPVPTSGTTTCDEIYISSANSAGQTRANLTLFFIYKP